MTQNQANFVALGATDAGAPTPFNTISAAQWAILGAAVEWTAWVPTLTGDADLSGYTIARYFRIGKICFFYFTAESKNVTTSGRIEITLPFTMANTGFAHITGSVYDGTAWVGQVLMQISANANILAISKTVMDGTWVGNETNVFLRLEGFFEIA